MIEKVITAMTFVTLGTSLYSVSAQQVEGVISEAQLVAGSMQSNQLEIALEQYHLERGYYPRVRDNDLGAELYDANKLKEADIHFDIEYSTSMNGQTYHLLVHELEAYTIESIHNDE